MSIGNAYSRLEGPASFGSSPGAARRSFLELSVLNRCLGGARSILANLAPLARAAATSGEFSVLDLGTGSADIPRSLMRWMRARKLACRIVALDRHPEAIASAAALSDGFPEIRLVRGDVLAVPFGPNRFDFVISSMLLHYFPGRDVERLLEEMMGLARKAVIVADVERHWFPCLAIDWLSWASGGRIIREAFRDTVLRGFTRKELARLAQSAGFVRWEIRRYFPFRLVLVGFAS